jgi:hypothetical protein
VIFHSGWGAWDRWLSAPHVWLLLTDAYGFDPTHDSVADVAVNEVAVTGYARLPVASAEVFIGTTGTTQHRVYGAESPTWSSLTPGSAVDYLIVAEVGADDASSPLLACWPELNFTTDLSADLTVRFPAPPAGGGWFTDPDTRTVFDQQIFGP